MSIEIEEVLRNPDEWDFPEDYTLEKFCEDTGLPKVNEDLWKNYFFKFRFNFNRLLPVVASNLVQTLYWTDKSRDRVLSNFWDYSVEAVTSGKVIDLLKIDVYYRDISQDFKNNFLEFYSKWAVLYCAEMKKGILNPFSREIIEKIFIYYISTAHSSDIHICYPQVNELKTLDSIHYLPKIISLVKNRLNKMTLSKKIKISRQYRFHSFLEIIYPLFADELYSLKKKENSTEIFSIPKMLLIYLQAEIEGISDLSYETLETIFPME